MTNTTARISVDLIHYLDFNPDGSPVVVLLHGLGADATSWGFQIPALCEVGMRPIALDLPGFGQTLPGPGRWTIDRAAADTASLCSALVKGPVVVAGISLGGAVALQLALDHPELVEKLVLINTFACLRPRRFEEMGYLLGRFVVTNLRGKQYQAETVARRLFPLPEQADLRQELINRILKADERVYRDAMISVGMFNVRKRLKKINAPTLVISAENDNTVPLAAQAELVKGIPGARQVMIANAGHAVIADQPAAFNQALIAFIRGESDIR